MRIRHPQRIQLLDRLLERMFKVANERVDAREVMMLGAHFELASDLRQLYRSDFGTHSTQAVSERLNLAMIALPAGRTDCLDLVRRIFEKYADDRSRESAPCSWLVDAKPVQDGRLDGYGPG